MNIQQVENTLGVLLAQSNVKLVSPTSKHWRIFTKLLKETNAKGDLMMDAHLATLAIEHEAKVASTDSDFKLFSDLEYFNPLTEN
ncbi:MAG: PIN domain-containing protein [Acidobacteriota bacterium]|jgi:predicted nucleic acid-binding protein|nr:PIN domain-containing protein [Acidobacteriota bacterium]